MKYIVDFVNTTTEEQINEFLSANGCTTLSVFSAFDKCYLVESTSRPPVTTIIESVVDDSETVIIPLIYNDSSQVLVDLTDETEWWKTASLAKIDLGQPVCTFPRKGSTTCVYIMDSGINSSHVEFEDADITNLYSYNNDFQDYNGHGTALASVISGKTCGVTSAKLKAVKIFQADTPTYQSHFLSALDAVYNDVIANPGILPVVNMSWTVAKNTYIENKIRQLISNGVWVVCAAGNNGQAISNVTPASMPEVFTVGAYSRDLTPCNFSNYPSAINTTPGETNYGEHFIWAPGEHIKSAVGSGYDFISGTSVAAAIVSAGVAYNSYLHQLPDGTVRYKVRSHPWMAIKRSSKNILNFSGNYANSNNIIAGFFVSYYGESNLINRSHEEEMIMVKSGEFFDVELGPLTHCTGDASNFEITTELPQGLVQQGNYLVGTINTDTYVVRRIEYVRTLRTGEVENCAILLYVTSNAYTPETVPVEDQIIDVELLVAQCCGNTGGGNCVNGTDCPGCSNCGDIKTPQCVCFGGGGGGVCPDQSCP